MKMYAAPSRFVRAYTCAVLLLCFISPFSLQADEWSDPCCSIPHDVVTSCDDLPAGFDPSDWDLLEDLFGEPNGYYHCNNQNWHELDPEIYLDNCGVGTINRRFKAYYQSSGWGDPTEVHCEQTITITPSHDYVIRFPPDAVANCEEPEAEDIQFDELSCDLLAVSTEDLKFQTGSESCYKILRTYRVINWCEYDGHSDPIVIGRDEDCDDVPGDEAVWVIRRPSNKIFIDRTSNENDYYPSVDEQDPYCGHMGQKGFWRKIWLSGGSSYYNSQGFYQYTQHLKVMDNIPPVVDVTNPDPFCSYSEDQGAGCPGWVDFSFSVSDECSGTASVKVFLFEDNVPVPFTASNNIADEVLSGSYPDFTIKQYLPLGNHTYEIHVKDGCGTSSAVRVPVEVVDCDPPSIVCLHGLSTSLMPLEANVDIDGDGDIDPGAMEIWAVDFVIDQYGDDCSGPISYSINRVGETAHIDSTGIVFTCDDGSEVEVEIYVWDSAHNPYQEQPDGTVGGPNYDLCRTYIRLNTNDLCGEDVDDDAANEEEEEEEEVTDEEEEEDVTEDPPYGMARLAGMVYTPDGERLMDTEVRLSGLMMDTIVIDTIVMDTMMMDTLVTDTLGAYGYHQAQMGGTYILTPFRDGDDLNGVNASDMARLSDHLQGRTPLTSPFQLIAADLNGSGTVDSEDLTILLKIMLGITTSLEESPSWRFIDASHVFPNVANPWEEGLPEHIQVDAVVNNQDSLEFYGIKVGDLDYSAQFDSPENHIDERNTAPSIGLIATTNSLQLDEMFTVDISTDGSTVLGGQLSFNYNPNLLEIGELSAAQSEFVVVDETTGSIRVALLTDTDNLQLGIPFRSKYKGDLSQSFALDVNNPNELVDDQYNIRPVALSFETAATTDWLLTPNYPNPFRQATTFELNLPKESLVTVEIYSLSGQRLLQRNQVLPGGFNQVQLKAKELAQDGILWYKISVDGDARSGKMILIK